MICTNYNWGCIQFAKNIWYRAHLTQIQKQDSLYDAIHISAVINWCWTIWHRTSLHKDWNEPLLLCLKFKLNRDKRTTMETECSYLPFELFNPLVQRVQLLLLLLARSLCSAQALLKLLNLEEKNKKWNLGLIWLICKDVWTLTYIGLLSSPHLRRDSTSSWSGILISGY